jgi:multidrug resistance efflux pump
MRKTNNIISITVVTVLIVTVVTISVLFSKLNSSTNIDNTQIAEISTAAISGGLIKYEVPFGAHIKKGQIIVKIDTEQYIDQLKIDRAKMMDDLQIYNRYIRLYDKHPHAIISDQDLFTAKYTLAGDVATLKLDQAYIDHCTVKAPFTGTVTNILFYEGSGGEILDETAC